MIKDVIRLKWASGLTHEEIAAALKISKGVVAKYVALASVTGLDLTWPQSTCACSPGPVSKRICVSPATEAASRSGRTASLTVS